MEQLAQLIWCMIHRDKLIAMIGSKDLKQSVVLQTSTAGRRRMLAVGNGEPGVQLTLGIPTTSAQASNATTSITNAVNTGSLSTLWGEDGQSRQLLSCMLHV